MARALERRRLLRLALGGGLVGGAGIAAAAAMAPGRSASPVHNPSAAQRALSKGGPWLNTPPIRAEALRGKVVLVNIWTYSCINSLRPMPYVRAWADRYRSRGLMVIGVHTPEFAFEKDVANVRRAVGDLNLGFPVVLDSDYRIWRAFENEAWPAFYLIDAAGQVRQRVYGEGKYEDLEREIQRLLAEATGTPVRDPLVAVAGRGVEAAPNVANLGSPETYLGYAKATNFASPGGQRPDAPSVYASPAKLALNRWALSGLWTVGGEFATLSGGPGTAAFRCHARDLHMVLGPAVNGRPVRIRVRIDGAAPGASHGVDVDAAGLGTVDVPRMYQLVRQAGAIVDRTVEVEVLDPGLRAYVYTFG